MMQVRRMRAEWVVVVGWLAVDRRVSTLTSRLAIFSVMVVNFILRR